LGEPWTVAEHTASDGYTWRYRRYDPAGKPRAEIVYLHGIQSHAGWYEYSCTCLRNRGFGVSFLDRRGSGMNQQSRGDAHGYQRLLEDIAEFITARLQPANTSHIPVFLVAVSWGGKLATGLLRQHAQLVDGLALLCPGFFPQVQPPFLTRLAILCSRLFSPRRLFPIPLNDPALFTASPRWQQFLRDDPLALHQATARLLFSSRRLDRFVRHAPAQIRVPALLLLAGKDRIIDNARTREYVERFASTNKRVIEYPEAHHTLELEPEPDRFIGDLLAWMEEIVARAAC
jgi:alpha-beta hydrolase superfamily lysophospholipase